MHKIIIFKHNLYKFSFYFAVLFISGCSSMYKTSYQLFVDAMNVYIDNPMTIEELSDFSLRASNKYLQDIEKVEYNHLKYHYALPNIFNRHCHYFFLVNAKTRIVENWGFDKHISDPKKNCGASG